MSPAAVAAVAAIIETALQLLKDHSAGTISEADILAKAAAFTTTSATDDAAADAAAESVLDAKFKGQ